MSGGAWVNRVCDLEREGRKVEAQELFTLNTTPQQRARLAELGSTISKAMTGAMPSPEATAGLAKILGRIRVPNLNLKLDIPPEVIEEIEKILDQYKASRELPEGDPKREAWEIVGSLTPRAAMKFWRYLPPIRSRGRPRGSGRVQCDEELFRAVAIRAYEADISITRAAREILGDVGGAKNKADYIKKVMKRKKIELN